ncbi:MAG: hypothetical protein VX265_08990 [Myxococcota bacterium]|nr:hypothetical protein [Myxococcota bacterium]
MEQSLWDLFWLPPWAEQVDRPELLYTRSAQDQHALNQVLRVRAGDSAMLPSLVAEVDQAHRGVTSRWILARDSQHPDLPALLLRHGWKPEHRHHVRAASTERPAAAAEPDVRVLPVEDTRTLLDCIRVSQLAFGRKNRRVSEERIADELAQLTRPRARVHRFVAYDASTGTPMASGGLNTFPDLGVGFLWGGGTIPAYRRRGAYRGLVAARMARAAVVGCELVGVYAREGTSDPIMAALGFSRFGTMLTWTRSGDHCP